MAYAFVLVDGGCTRKTLCSPPPDGWGKPHPSSPNLCDRLTPVILWFRAEVNRRLALDLRDKALLR